MCVVTASVSAPWQVKDSLGFLNLFRFLPKANPPPPRSPKSGSFKPNDLVYRKPSLLGAKIIGAMAPSE